MSASLCTLGLLPGMPITVFLTAIFQVASWSTSGKTLPSPRLSCHSSMHIPPPLHCVRPISMSFSSGQPGLPETLSQKSKAEQPQQNHRAHPAEPSSLWESGSPAPST